MYLDWPHHVVPSAPRVILAPKNHQKNPRVRKIFCPHFWGRKWLRQFYGRLEKCVLSAGKTMPIKFLVLGGGGYFGFFGVGGGSADFIFMGARIFSYGPLVQPPGRWKGVKSPKLLSLYFLGKSDDNKNATSKMLFFLCFRPTIKFQGGSPDDPLFEPPAPPFDSTSQKLFLSSFRRLWVYKSIKQAGVFASLA